MTKGGQMSKNINIRFIPQKEQRYDTLGDYWETDDSIEFRVTETNNPNWNMFILVHELWEDHRNRMLGIKEEDVTEFDVSHPELDIPGNCVDAPYHKTHMEADAIERMCVVMAGEDFEIYDNKILDFLKEK
jgi:hypothetical protein